jgi:hypothetical protein
MQLLFLPAAALLNEKLGFVEDLVSIAPADAQALTCTRRC